MHLLDSLNWNRIYLKGWYANWSGFLQIEIPTYDENYGIGRWTEIDWLNVSFFGGKEI